MPLHLLVKWEVVSPNSREGQYEILVIIVSLVINLSALTLWWGLTALKILYSLVLILYLKCGGGFGGGGSVMFFSHFMLFPKKVVCWRYCIVPLHLQLLVKYLTLDVTYFLTSWRYGILTVWHTFRTFEVMTYILRHDVLFDVMTYFLTSWCYFHTCLFLPSKHFIYVRDELGDERWATHRKLAIMFNGLRFHCPL